MAYEFTFTPRFQKHFKGLTVQEKKQLKNKLELLAENPSHPSLRTKRIQGTTDLFECSVNMDIRIIPDTDRIGGRSIRNWRFSLKKDYPDYKQLPV